MLRGKRSTRESLRESGTTKSNKHSSMHKRAGGLEGRDEG